MKKFFSIALAIVMLFSLGTAAFAAVVDATTEKGSITITNAVPGQTYGIYKVADLVKYDTETGMYLYTYNAAWEGFFGDRGEGSKYVNRITIDGEDYLTWGDDVATDAETVKEFAAAALNFAKGRNPDKDIIAGDAADGQTRTTVTFDNLILGYYLVESSLGTIVSIDTTDKNVEIEEKNEIPTVEKEIVNSDKTPDKNTASIGDKVNYQTTISVEAGAVNYYLHDTMSEGLTFNNDIVVTVGETTLTTAQYTITESDEHSFTIKFEDEYIATIVGSDIVVKYSATLNENAVIGKGDDTNTNETYLTFGDKNTESNHDKTVTNTYEFQLVKTTNANKVLDGATFELYTVDPATDGAQPVALVATANGYRFAQKDETGITEFEAGTPIISGLKNGTYYLSETAAPAGYNKTDAVITVTIADANNTASFDEVQTNEYESGGVQVINNTGIELPSTGGIGTTIFYIIGGILVVGAGIFMVVRKRMSAEKA